ncbi:MAG TPA: hypothetical protein VMV49_09700 [Candidatus Deferrimicrobium sp.]|nr:hypothetical protein [Candidatus Deferrimicrobium sp.]
MGELGRFKKLLGGLGKRLYNWKETKESMNFLSFMYETILEEYAGIFNGDYETAMDTLIDLVRPMSEEVVSKLLTEVKVLGIPFKTFITQNAGDLPYIISTTLYAVFGAWSEKVFNKPVLIPASESAQRVDTIIITLNMCPFCCNTIIPKQALGTHNYGKLLTLTIEQMVQTMEDYAGNDYMVVARELKCFLNGDSHGELQVWLYPRNQLDLMEQNPYLKSIK